MGMDNWKQIWDAKPLISINGIEDEFVKFCELKKANGFDVAVGDEESYFRSFYREWNNFFSTINKIAKGKIESVYEVGCGSGVNLFMFDNRNQDIELGGCDYSESMVKNARTIVRRGDVKCCYADEIEIISKYDLVMSDSVFQYFESQEYAETVLRKMIEKSNKIVYLGEIHNKEFEEELIKARQKTIENYEERYKGLEKLFLSKEWIVSIASDYGREVLFTDVDNREYLNSIFVFNCYIYS